MQAFILETQAKAIREIESASTLEELEDVRIKYLGRKNGTVTKIFGDLKDLTTDEKKRVGPLANQVKVDIETKLATKLKELQNRTSPLSHSGEPATPESFKTGALSADTRSRRVLARRSPTQSSSDAGRAELAGMTLWSTTDVTLPANLSPNHHPLGHFNPLTQVIEQAKEIFGHLGFTFLDGPEIDNDLYNFQKLRLDLNHPSRDTQDTYYVADFADKKTKSRNTRYEIRDTSESNQLLLRTHTSSMQVRYMEMNKPPIRVLFPGKVFRRDQIDATHLPSFNQIEGLLVGEGIKLTDLLGTLRFFLTKLYGEDIKVRFYGHNFPYTEPSIEVEIFYNGKWLEMLGAGMVHPEVIEGAGLDPKKYTGFAFGMGAERLAMVKYNIDDIRLIYSGDQRFLDQF